MIPPSEELRALANSVVTNSIVAQATERLILQIVEVCAEHERLALIVALTAERDEARDDLREHKEALAYWETEATAARAQAFAECEEIARRVAAEYDGATERYGRSAATDIADDIHARAASMLVKGQDE